MSIARKQCLLLLASMYLLIVETVAQRNPPRLLPLAENRETRKVVPSGSVVHLSCPVEKPENDELFIDWMKDGESLNTFDPRIRKTSGGTLKIKEVIPEDTGLYICHVVNGFGSVEIGTTLIVLDEEQEETMENNNSTNDSEKPIKRHGIKPFLTEVSKFPHSIIQRNYGGNVKFKCVASGQPRPLLTWFRNGQIISDKDMKKRRWTLTLTELKVGDSGNYTCIAFNSYGNASASFQLQVMGHGKKAEIKELYPGNITVTEGAKVTFQCRVHSDIKPHIQWLKRMFPKELINLDSTDTSEFHRNHKYGQHIIEFEGKEFSVLKAPESILQKDGSFLNKLTFTNIKFSDFGQYACLGATPYGYDFKSAFLTVIPPARPLPPLLNQVIEDNFPFWMIVVISGTGVCIIVMACVCYLFHKKYQKRSANHTTDRVNSSSYITSPKVGKIKQTSVNYETNTMYPQTAPSSSFSPRLNSELRHTYKDKRSSTVSPSNFSSAPRTIPCEYYRYDDKSYGYLC